jgi:hypothetical protein
MKLFLIPVDIFNNGTSIGETLMFRLGTYTYKIFKDQHSQTKPRGGNKMISIKRQYTQAPIIKPFKKSNTTTQYPRINTPLIKPLRAEQKRLNIKEVTSSATQSQTAPLPTTALYTKPRINPKQHKALKIKQADNIASAIISRTSFNTFSSRFNGMDLLSLNNLSVPIISRNGSQKRLDLSTMSSKKNGRSYPVRTNYGSGFKPSYNVTEIQQRSKYKKSPLQYLAVMVTKDNIDIKAQSPGAGSKEIFAASTLKLAAAMYDIIQKNGRTTKPDMQRYINMFGPSSNVSWNQIRVPVALAYYKKNGIPIPKSSRTIKRKGNALIAKALDQYFTKKYGVNPGLYNSHRKGREGSDNTAEDLVRLMILVVKNTFPGAENILKASNMVETNHNRGEKQIPRHLKVAGKTGSLPGKPVNNIIQAIATTSQGKEAFQITGIMTQGLGERSNQLLANVGGLSFHAPEKLPGNKQNIVFSQR